MWRAKFGAHIQKKFNRPNRERSLFFGLGPGGLCQGSKSLSWDYFGCGSEKQSHVIDSGGSNLCFGE